MERATHELSSTQPEAGFLAGSIAGHHLAGAPAIGPFANGSSSTSSSESDAPGSGGGGTSGSCCPPVRDELSLDW